MNTTSRKSSLANTPPVNKASSIYSLSKSIPRSYLREEAESILAPKAKREADEESIWTRADDESIAHLSLETTPSDDYSLPKGWAKVFSVTHGKWFFANSKTKTTTWVDPRDKLWRKANWAECDPNTDECPYGWEIAEDPAVGKYFIDHINHINTLDDPRINKFEIQVKTLKTFFALDKDNLILAKQAQLDEQSKELQLLKLKIAKENKGKVGILNDDDSASSGVSSVGTGSSTPGGIELSDGYSLGKYAKIRAANVRLQDLQISIAKLRQELEDMKNDINELEQLTERCEASDVDQLETQKRVQADIEAYKKAFMSEVNIRAALESDLEQLLEIDVTVASSVKYTLPPRVEADPTPESFNEHVDLCDDAKTPSLKSTRLERELSLLELKKQVRAIKRQNAYLEAIAEKARQEISIALENPNKSDWQDDFGRPITPPWVKTVNEYVNQIENQVFSDLETKAKSGQELTFREKVFLLASSSKEMWSNFQQQSL